MNEQEVLIKAAESFTDKPKFIDIPIEPKNRLEKLLIKWKIKKGYLRYPVRKMLVGNREIIAAMALKFPTDTLSSDNILRDVFKASVTVSEDLRYIVAVAVQNDRHEPSETLLDQLKWVDDSVFAEILEKSISTADLQAFINSIVLVIGTKAPKEKTSLKDTREIIARTEEFTITEDTSE